MAVSVINAFQQRVAEIRLQDEARSKRLNTLQNDGVLEGWQHVAIHESSTNRLQAATRVNAERQLAPLSFAAQAASRGNTRKSPHNESAAEMANVIEFQHTLSTIVTRVEALETVCFDRLQNREMWQDVLERVAKLENEVAATKPHVQMDTILRSADLQSREVAPLPAPKRPDNSNLHVSCGSKVIVNLDDDSFETLDHVHLGEKNEGTLSDKVIPQVQLLPTDSLAMQDEISKHSEGKEAQDVGAVSVVDGGDGDLQTLARRVREVSRLKDREQELDKLWMLAGRLHDLEELPSHSNASPVQQIASVEIGREATEELLSNEGDGTEEATIIPGRPRMPSKHTLPGNGSIAEVRQELLPHIEQLWARIEVLTAKEGKFDGMLLDSPWRTIPTLDEQAQPLPEQQQVLQQPQSGEMPLPAPNATSTTTAVASTAPTTAAGTHELHKMGTQEFVRSLEQEYKLMPSAWDVLILIWLPELGFGGSISAMFIFLANFAMQVSFLVVCFLNFTDPNLTPTSVQDAKYFRTLIGHDDLYVDPSGNTLQQVVCGARDTLGLLHGGSQHDRILSTRRYLGSDGGALQQMFNGELMCLLSLLAWSLIMLREVGFMMDFISALMRFWPQATHRHTTLATDSVMLSFEAISVARISAVGFFVFLRICLAMMLYAVGCFWLANTDDVKDLLLNCLALGFVLDIDEMIFAAVSPSRTKALLRTIEPFRIEPRRHWHGAESKSVVFVILSISCTLYAYFFDTSTMTRLMRDIIYEMCEVGPLDFTYTVGEDGTSWLAKWNPQMQARGTLQEKVFADVREVIDGGSYRLLRRSIDPARFSQTVSAASRMSWEQVQLLLNAECTDAVELFAPSGRERVQNTFSVFLQNDARSKVFNCQAVKEFCFKEGFVGKIARLYCARTCTCHIPESPIPTLSNVYGCPKACAGLVQSASKQLSCRQRTAQELRATLFWPAWASKAVGFGQAMLAYGCDFIPHLNMSDKDASNYRMAVCKGTTPAQIKPLAIACPELCQCSGPTTVWSGGMCAVGSSQCALQSYADTRSNEIDLDGAP